MLFVVLTFFKGHYGLAVGVEQEECVAVEFEVDYCAECGQHGVLDGHVGTHHAGASHGGEQWNFGGYLCGQ